MGNGRFFIKTPKSMDFLTKQGETLQWSASVRFCFLEVCSYCQVFTSGLTPPEPAPYSFGDKRIGEEKRRGPRPTDTRYLICALHQKEATIVCATRPSVKGYKFAFGKLAKLAKLVKRQELSQVRKTNLLLIQQVTPLSCCVFLLFLYQTKEAPLVEARVRAAQTGLEAFEHFQKKNGPCKNFCSPIDKPFIRG